VGEEDVRSERWLGTTGRGIVLLRIEVVIRSFPHTIGKVRAAGILGSVVSVGLACRRIVTTSLVPVVRRSFSNHSAVGVGGPEHRRVGNSRPR
jgi:hypothetical protein